MFKCNTYFDGDVVSIAFNGEDGEATVGVMAPGEYEFGTSKHETMIMVSGGMKVKLPGEDGFKLYSKGDRFEVEANQKFNAVVETDTAYLCLYK